MAVSQTLTLTENYVNTAANSSNVRIQWKSKQTGESWNGYSRTAHYYVSINGGAETAYSVTYTLPQNSEVTILDTTITIPHKDDGSGSIAVRTWMDTGISAGVVQKSESLTLTSFPRAATMDSLTCTSTYVYGRITYKYTPKSANHYIRRRDYVNVGGTLTKFQTKDIGKKAAVQQIDNEQFNESELDAIYSCLNGSDTRVTIRITISTYSDSAYSKQVGDDQYLEISLKIPDNSQTKPTVTMTLAPVSSLGSQFSSIYIQGKSMVKGTVSAAGKYNATIKSKGLLVGGTSFNSMQSGVLYHSGKTQVIGTATDSRGFTGEVSKEITVIPYTRPRLMAMDGESGIVCDRCDSNGVLSDSGTFLKVKVKRGYSYISVDGVQKNFCTIKYRHKAETAGSYSDWVTLLEGSNTASDSVDATIPNVCPIATTSYMVQIKAEDNVGEAATETFFIQTESVTYHEKAGGNGAAFGKYSEEDDLLDVAWNARVRKELRLGSNGDAIDDFVIEQGTSGIWSYRKWYSGIAECWGRYSGTPTNLGGKRNEVEVSLPFVFSGDVYHVQLTGGQNCYAPYTTDFADCNAKGTVVHANSGFYFSYLYGSETAYSYSVNINVTGWWK